MTDMERQHGRRLEQRSPALRRQRQRQRRATTVEVAPRRRSRPRQPLAAALLVLLLGACTPRAAHAAMSAQCTTVQPVW